jgi:hypothetical protein
VNQLVMMDQKNLRNKINVLEIRSGSLGPNFGKLTKNPLLKGINLTEIIKASISRASHSLDLWQQPKSTRKDKNLFRTSIVYVLDKVNDGIEAEGNIHSDIKIAQDIKRILEEILAIIDNSSKHERSKSSVREASGEFK